MISKTKTTSSEIHLFIIWEHARSIEEKILDDIRSKFKIVKIYEVHWSKDRFAENLSRFYGTLLPTNSRKEIHVGTNPFLVVIVEDADPVYETHTTSKGDADVNTKLFTSKATHREWTGGGHRVHGSNTQEEADHNLTLLFGKNTADLMQSINQSSTKIEIWENDPIGTDGWESLEQLLYVLNSTIPYVLLRNFDGIPKNYYAENHGDIDMLVSNYQDAVFLTNAKPVFKSKNRVLHTVRINDSDVKFDFRSIDDGYYDANWETSILKNRIFLSQGFYAPNPRDYFYSLLYHALIHKPALGDDYKQKLIKLAPTIDEKLSSASFQNGAALSLLSDFLLKNKYAFTQPIDKSVYFHAENISVGTQRGVSFIKQRYNPLRNYLKKNKVPIKHYIAKSKRIVKRHINRIRNAKKN